VPKDLPPFNIGDELANLEYPFSEGHTVHEARTKEIPVLAEGDKIE
jgi:hypothetical protein